MAKEVFVLIMNDQENIESANMNMKRSTDKKIHLLLFYCAVIAQSKMANATCNFWPPSHFWTTNQSWEHKTKPSSAPSASYLLLAEGLADLHYTRYQPQPIRGLLSSWTTLNNEKFHLIITHSKCGPFVYLCQECRLANLQAENEDHDTSMTPYTLLKST